MFFTFVHMDEMEKQREAFKKVVMALLDAKRLSQRQVALELDTSPSNFNQRILAGSMRPHMIMKLNQIMGVDLLQLVQRHADGTPLIEIVQEAIRQEQGIFNPKVNADTIEYQRIIQHQNDVITGLQAQIKEMMDQMNRWMNQDSQKSENQKDLKRILDAYRKS